MKNFTDDELLDFLMTSDFDENLSPEELKSLLIKFRYFFRIVSSRQNTIEIQKKRFDSELENIKVENKKREEDLIENNRRLFEILKSISGRRLSFTERLLGKVKLKTNEIFDNPKKS
jgi:hypothetical protein